MVAICGECGTALPASGACIDHVHALLAAGLTVTSIDVAASDGQVGQVEVWARSVAEHRFL